MDIKDIMILLDNIYNIDIMDIIEHMMDIMESMGIMNITAWVAMAGAVLTLVLS